MTQVAQATLQGRYTRSKLVSMTIHTRRSPIRRLRLRSAGLLGALVMASSSSALQITIPLPGATDSYAECVLDQIGTKTGPVEVQAIESGCRTRFPGPSRRSMLDARSVDACYRKYEDKVAHRQAAQAVFGACQDYFRANTAEAATAMRGARLN